MVLPLSSEDQKTYTSLSSSKGSCRQPIGSAKRDSSQRAIERGLRTRTEQDNLQENQKHTTQRRYFERVILWRCCRFRLTVFRG
jgi:hypothetical protein